MDSRLHCGARLSAYTPELLGFHLISFPFFYFFLGVESGGHGASYALPLLNLLPLTLAAMPADSPPVLAAGGLANGGHVAAALTLGADGVVLGT
jgi:hypothetical protein